MVLVYNKDGHILSESELDVMIDAKIKNGAINKALLSSQDGEVDEEKKAEVAESLAKISEIARI